jgi:hypothetical protein
MRLSFGRSLGRLQIYVKIIPCQRAPVGARPSRPLNFLLVALKLLSTGAVAALKENDGGVLWRR